MNILQEKCDGYHVNSAMPNVIQAKSTEQRDHNIIWKFRRNMFVDSPFKIEETWPLNTLKTVTGVLRASVICNYLLADTAGHT